MNMGFLGDDENVLELHSACWWSYNLAEYTKTCWTVHFKRVTLYYVNYISIKKASLTLAVSGRVVKKGSDLESQTLFKISF